VLLMILGTSQPRKRLGEGLTSRCETSGQWRGACCAGSVACPKPRHCRIVAKWAGQVAEPPGGLPQCNHFRIWSDPLPQCARILVNTLVGCCDRSFPHVLRGRDVRNSLWETGWTLPRSVGIGADQV